MEIIEDSIVGIKNGLIVVVGQNKDSGCAALQAKETINASGCIVMPGLINTHTHLPMVCFRGMADDLPLMDWLTKHIFPAEARFVNKKMVYDGAMLAMAEMILSGTTIFCDGYFLEDTITEAVSAAGMRAVVSQGFADFIMPDKFSFEKMSFMPSANFSPASFDLNPRSKFSRTSTISFISRSLAASISRSYSLTLRRL